MLRRFCKERKLHIDYKRRARAQSSCLLLKSDERESENTVNGWEMLSGGFRHTLCYIPRLEPTSTLVELNYFSGTHSLWM